MKLRYALPLVLVASLAAAALWLWPSSTAEEHATIKSPHGISGAAEALIWWDLQRSYPSGIFPSQGLTAAASQRRAMEATERAGGTAWKPMGPTNNGGRTLAVALNPLRGESVWLGSAGGGLWRSYDAGLNGSWERVSTGIPITSTTDVRIAPTDTNTIYVGTGEVYRYQDTQGGVVERPTRGSYGIGIIKSEDGGSSWSHVLDWSLNQERGVARIRINPNDPADVWAATTEGVYRSTNGGDTWTNVHPVVMAMDIVLRPDNPNWAIASHGDQESAGKGIYRTTNGGATWTQLTSGVPTNFVGKIILDTHPNPDIVYASVGNGIKGPSSTTLIRTLNGGDTWSTVTTLDYAIYQGWFAHYVGINPHRPDTVFLAGVPLYKSYDGGFTTTGGSAPIHVDHHAIGFHPTDPDIAYFAEDGGIYRTTDGGQTYENLNDGYVTLQFYNGTSHSALDSTFSLGGAQDNGSWRWNGQPDWQDVGGGDGAWTVIDPTDDSRWCTSSQYLNFFCRNGGSDPPSGGNTAFIAPYVVAPSDPDRLYAGRAVVFRSDNFGQSWTATNGGAALDGNAAVGMDVAASNADVVYVTTAPDRIPNLVGARTGVFVTTDGGTNWTNVTGSLPDRIFHDITVDPNDPNVAYVVASSFGTGHVFKTTDTGASWTDVTGTLPDAPTNAVTVDPLNSDVIYVGNDVGVFISLDGGATWDSYNAGLPEAVMVADLKVSPMDRTLRVATHGNGMWKRSLDGIPVASEPGAVPTDFALDAVRPNPVQDRATVAFRLDAPQPVRLAVYDVRGRQVALLTEGTRAAGRHEVALDARRLAAGTYLVRLTAGDASVSQRVTVVR